MTKQECLQRAEESRHRAIDQCKAWILADTPEKYEQAMMQYRRYMNAAQIRKLSDRREFLTNNP